MPAVSASNKYNIWRTKIRVVSREDRMDEPNIESTGNPFTMY